MNIPIEQLSQTVADALKSGGLISVLTGAGVSAESGIPTFRGPDGYWTVGSKNYQPTEIATQAMLLQNPKEVWKWFLFRRGVCNQASPNLGHFAIVKMEELLGDRFRLITQNVDGLHLRAGNTGDRTYQIHGNLNYMRCSHEWCTHSIYPLPETLPSISRGEELASCEWEKLSCPECGGITRPHVLLWDECYNEHHYRWQSSLNDANKTVLLIVVGTTGSANLPNQIANAVLRHGGAIVDINPDFNVFSKAAQLSSSGLFLQGKSAEILPTLANLITELL